MRLLAPDNSPASLLGWLLLAAVGLAGCSRAHEPTQVAPAPAHAGAAATTNVPALLGLPIEELQRRLGAAQPLSLASRGALEPGIDKPDSLVSFQTGGLTLIANYSGSTHRVSDIMLLGHQEDSLMNRASLSSNAGSYLVLPLFQNGRPGRLIGLRVTAID